MFDKWIIPVMIHGGYGLTVRLTEFILDAIRITILQSVKKWQVVFFCDVSIQVLKLFANKTSIYLGRKNGMS